VFADERGAPVRLEPALAAGGEGSVHPVVGAPTLLAKVYTRAPSKQKVAKLGAMLRQLRAMDSKEQTKLTNLLGWPVGLLSQNGAVVGIQMRRFDKCEPVQHLYNPAQRLKFFPKAGWRFVVAAAQNLAAAVDEIHKTGCVIGDVNQSNFLVDSGAQVKVIDCDSFQVPGPGQPYLCEVGVAHYTPPELQGQRLSSIVRTPNHDRFGLAVLIFQFLFVGRHPYAGVYLGAGDLAFEDGIRDYRFAYGPRAQAVQMAAPPFTPTLADLPPEFTTLFCRAFERGSEASNARPTAIEWYRALNGLSSQTQVCAADPGHEYWKGVRGCVWCRLASGNGPDYFFAVGNSPTDFTLDDARLRGYEQRLKAARLEDFPLNSAKYEPAQPCAPAPLPDDIETQQPLCWILGAATALGVALMLVGCVNRHALVAGLLTTITFGIWFWLVFANSPYRRELTKRRAALRRAKSALSRVEHEWEMAVWNYGQQHATRSGNVAGFAARCRQLVSDYQRERAALEARREELARVQFLRSHFIADATIDKIGEGRKQTLAAYNILTAFDVDPNAILQIKGFGPAYTSNLVAWRESVAKQFRFNPKSGVPEADLRALAARYRKAQADLFRELETMLIELEGSAPAVRAALRGMEPDLRSATAALRQAEADEAALHSA
jgi:DNA-binding helix-hairpin-helix protein with protein kinase domain